MNARGRRYPHNQINLALASSVKFMHMNIYNRKTEEFPWRSKIFQGEGDVEWITSLVSTIKNTKRIIIVMENHITSLVEGGG